MPPPQGPKVEGIAGLSLALEGAERQVTFATHGTWGFVLSQERARTGTCVQPVNGRTVRRIVLISLRGHTLNPVGGHLHPLQLPPLVVDVTLRSCS